MTEDTKSSNNVLADLKFYERLVSNQTKQIMDKMNKAIAGRRKDEISSELLGAVAAELGSINARLQVVEMALVAEQPTDVVIPEIVNAPANDASKVIQISRGLPETVTVLSNTLSTLENFHETELTGSGLEYNWTGEAVKTEINLLVSRKTEKELRVRIVNTLKRDALKKLRIKIDGQEVRYQLMYDGELNCLFATLPAVPHKSDKTHITIIYPERCTPESLNISVDNRHLGIAINSISVAAKESEKDGEPDSTAVV